MSNSTTGFVMGMVISLCLSGLAYNISGAKEVDDQRVKALKTCEKELPRDVTCILIAVPNKGENK